MDKTLRVLNDLVQEKLIGQYAIGGAMALLFYTEPAVTFDLDVFCFLPSSGNLLVTLTPVYDYLERRGYGAQREHVLIEGIPVQIIPTYNALVAEAVEMAADKAFFGVPTRVLRPEHLLAIMLQTGRAKDRLRAAQLREDLSFDSGLLNQILARHNLAQAWQRLQELSNE